MDVGCAVAVAGSIAERSCERVSSLLAMSCACVLLATGSLGTQEGVSRGAEVPGP